MNNTIQLELKKAKEKMVEEVDCGEHTLAKLTRDNVAIVEAMIQNDSAYRRSSDKEAVPTYKNDDMEYGGSTAYWMTLLKSVLIDKIKQPCSYKKIITGAVKAVDRENSTHLNADGCGREEIIKRLYRMNRDELLESLKDPSYNDMLLFRKLSDKTAEKKGARRNPSFASKFCHYACFYIYEGTKHQDNYPIYDSILRTVIPWYLDYYQIKEEYDLNDYKDYRKAVDSIRKTSGKKTGIKISRNGFDHLLWYYHKGRI